MQALDIEGSQGGTVSFEVLFMFRSPVSRLDKGAQSQSTPSKDTRTNADQQQQRQTKRSKDALHQTSSQCFLMQGFQGKVNMKGKDRTKTGQ